MNIVELLLYFAEESGLFDLGTVGLTRENMNCCLVRLEAAQAKVRSPLSHRVHISAHRKLLGCKFAYKVLHSSFQLGPGAVAWKSISLMRLLVR